MEHDGTKFLMKKSGDTNTGVEEIVDGQAQAKTSVLKTEFEPIYQGVGDTSLPIVEYEMLKSKAINKNNALLNENVIDASKAGTPLEESSYKPVDGFQEITSKKLLTEEPETAEENLSLKKATTADIYGEIMSTTGRANVNDGEEEDNRTYVEKETIAKNEEKEYGILATEATRSTKEVKSTEVMLRNHAEMKKMEDAADEEYGTKESMVIEEKEATSNASNIFSSETTSSEKLTDKGEIREDEKRDFVLDPITVIPSVERQVEKQVMLPATNNQKTIEDVNETIETIQEPQEQEKTSLSLSHAQIPEKEYQDGENRDFQATPENPNAAKEVEYSEEGKPGEGSPETINKTTPYKPKDQTNQATEKPKTEVQEGSQVEEDEADVGDDNENKKADSVSDAPVMVEASKDIDVKTPHKKSHNIPEPKTVDQAILYDHTFPLETLEGAKGVEKTDITQTVASSATSSEEIKPSDRVEVESIKPEEASTVEPKLAEHEIKIEVHGTVLAADVDDVGQGLGMGETITNESEVVREVPKPLFEGLNHGLEANTVAKDASVLKTQVENIEKEVQNSSSVFSPNEESHENEISTFEYTEDDILKSKETSGILSQLQNIEAREKSEADEAKAEEAKDFDAVCESKDYLEEIHETKTSPSEEISDEVKMEEETNNVAGKISDSEAVGGDVPADESTGVSKCSIENTETAANINYATADKTTEAIVPKSAIQSRVLGVENAYEPETSPTVQKTHSEAKDNETAKVNASDVEENKSFSSFAEPRNQAVEDIQERGTSPTVGENDMNGVEQEAREAPETLNKEINQDAEASSKVEFVPSQSIEAQKTKEQEEKGCEPVTESKDQSSDKDHNTEAISKNKALLNENVIDSSETGTPLDESSYKPVDGFQVIEKALQPDSDIHDSQVEPTPMVTDIVNEQLEEAIQNLKEGESETRVQNTTEETEDIHEITSKELLTEEPETAEENSTLKEEITASVNDGEEENDRTYVEKETIAENEEKEYEILATEATRSTKEVKSPEVKVTNHDEMKKMEDVADEENGMKESRVIEEKEASANASNISSSKTTSSEEITNKGEIREDGKRDLVLDPITVIPQSVILSGVLSLEKTYEPEASPTVQKTHSEATDDETATVFETTCKPDCEDIAEICTQTFPRKNKEDTKNGVEETESFPAVAIGEDRLEEYNPILEVAKTSSTSSDNETTKTTQTDDANKAHERAVLNVQNIHETSTRQIVGESDAYGSVNVTDVEENKSYSSFAEPKNQVVEDIQETGTITTVGEIDINGEEQEAREAPETLTKEINQDAGAASKEEYAPSQSIEAQKTKEQEEQGCEPVTESKDQSSDKDHNNEAINKNKALLNENVIDSSEAGTPLEESTYKPVDGFREIEKALQPDSNIHGSQVEPTPMVTDIANEQLEEALQNLKEGGSETRVQNTTEETEDIHEITSKELLTEEPETAEENSTLKKATTADNYRETIAENEDKEYEILATEATRSTKEVKSPEVTLGNHAEMKKMEHVADEENGTKESMVIEEKEATENTSNISSSKTTSSEDSTDKEDEKRDVVLDPITVVPSVERQAEKQVMLPTTNNQKAIEDVNETIETIKEPQEQEKTKAEILCKLKDQTDQATEEPKTEAEEGSLVEEEKADEDEDNENKKADSVSDDPVMVEALKDIDVKSPHKKSHNILSGVGSKVKHSIYKVKKAITGKSSHQKTSSAKEDKRNEAAPLL